MSVLCIIPARGGSKRLPQKTLLPLAGRPALAWTSIHAREARLVDIMVVSTDDDDIAALALEYGVQVVMRPDNISGDTATTATDSAFSPCKNSRLIWHVQEDEPVSLTYDWTKRKREQEMACQYRENGSIYVFSPDRLTSSLRTECS